MQVYYIPELNSNTFTLSKEESKHLIKVLRHVNGDKVLLTDGNGKKATATITNADIKKCELDVDTVEEIEKRKFSLHIACAPTKNMDRFEWFVEKAVEMGIEEITPIICEHSERKHLRIDRLKRIAITAMKQAQQWHLVRINEPITFKEFTKLELANKYIAHCEEDTEKTNLKDILPIEENIVITIGPEGDFSPKEITLAKENGFTPIALGDSRLRTETAAIAACCTVNLFI